MPDPSPAGAGDRLAFLGRLRSRLATGVPVNHTHPLPPPVPAGAVPLVVSSAVEPDDLLGSFTRTARQAGTIVDVLGVGEALDDRVAALVAQYRVRRAVVSAEPEAGAFGELLAGTGVDVARSTPGDAEQADLGVTSADALVASTGSLVLRSDQVGGRTVSLLPPVHLCVAPAHRVVAGTADVLRAYVGRGDDLPSNLLLVTGPSRTGDIEQILTKGVHGPVTVHVLVTSR